MRAIPRNTSWRSAGCSRPAAWRCISCPASGICPTSAHPRSARELFLPELSLVVVWTVDAPGQAPPASQGPQLARGGAGLPRLLRQRRVLSQHARSRAAVAGGVRKLRVADGVLHHPRPRRVCPALSQTADARSVGSALARIPHGLPPAAEAGGGVASFDPKASTADGRMCRRLRTGFERMHRRTADVLAVLPQFCVRVCEVTDTTCGGRRLACDLVGSVSMCTS